MHELAVCNALLSEVSAVARVHRATAVRVITVKIGPLAGVEPALLKQAFTLAQAGSVAHKATLSIELAEVRIRCTACGTISTVPPNRLCCTACGGYRAHLIGGDELRLERLEIETAGDTVPTPTCETGDV